MKSIKTILLLLVAIAVVSCQKEDITLVDKTLQSSQLTISVSDTGYTSNNPHTRAIENGYTTEFTAGDKIGFYVVVNNTIVSNNVPLTYNGTGWTGDAYYGGAGAKYFAYYPYQPTVTGTPSPTAAAAADFFAGVISSWTPATDQSTYAAYTGSDLMIGSGTLGSKQADGTYSLPFAMTHAMAMVIIELPRTKYTLSTDASYTWTFEAPDTKFEGFTPYSPTTGVYRYLVKPIRWHTPALLTGSYTGGNGKTKEYNVERGDIAAGNYVHYKVDGATVITKSHNLQVGDFYCKSSDGSTGYLIPGDASLTTEQQTACIGIVYSTDASRIGTEATKVLEKQGITPHGLVMALTNASEGCQWGEYGKDENSGGNDGEPFKANTDQLQKQYENVDGYGETHWIIDTYENSGSDLPDTYTAFYHASRYGTASGTEKYAAPSNTTGWFIPGMGQWWDILSNLGGINLDKYKNDTGNNTYIDDAAPIAVANMNTYLQKISGATQFRTGTWFWSSSEYSDYYACRVRFHSSGSLILGYYAKFDSYGRVRCSFAF